MSAADREFATSSFGSAVLLVSMIGWVSLLASCGDAEPPVVYIGGGGTSGDGGTAGTGAGGGFGGNGGDIGSGGTSGSGGGAGSGGTAGTGGASSCGSGSTGGDTADCVTNAVCQSCPTQSLCDSDEHCPVSGSVCIPSGCETHQGAPIGQCVPSWAPSCTSVDECPNTDNYECIQVGTASSRCIRTAGGCEPQTESYDCAPGFFCESGTCVDRRLPCESDFDCPKSHICHASPNASFRFCARVHRTCHQETDCVWLGVSFGSYCEDVDGDRLQRECAGELLSSPGSACSNSDCSTNDAPVCEPNASGDLATCGRYGLCLDASDCAPGFECLDSGLDGRKECAPANGSCDRSSDCAADEVCATPKNGDPPSCVCKEAT